ncbi:hypothetical protein OKA05_28700 [Luteolibacter arcticus]|uniref:Anti-sigma factor n=1 Tax=Luteolibacter arcticus TaxID=1581411 RepID=A0ABT3GSS0_9BACT|nr:hypothetical protein [Luteolibacter arcticus]MCW1926566.1 hypothetical protein [Luteolibacter arcticus]
MDSDLPARLLPARDLLARSLALHPRDFAPAMPIGLAADLTARFAPRMAESTPARVSLTDRFRNWLASPGFGLAAAAAVVVAAAIPMISAPDAGEIFRGDATASATDTVRIAFIGENADAQAEIKSSGTFEPIAFAADAASLPGPKVVIDFRTGTVNSVDRAGVTVYSCPLPADAKQAPGAVADAIFRLSGK